MVKTKIYKFVELPIMDKDQKKTSLKRKAITLEQKIEILDRLRKGEGSTAVAKSFNLNEASVRTIKRNEDKIRSSVAASYSVSAAKSSHTRPKIMELMEKSLMLWIEEKTQKRLPLSGILIRQKAVDIFQHLKTNQPSTSQAPSDQDIDDFVASKGWLERYKKRFSLHNLKLQGEVASADKDAAKNFSTQLATIVSEGGYTADQVFNADETGLWWKKMPNRTYISKSEKSAQGFKAAKDRITLLLCSNASGDFITKPMVIGKALNPRAMKKYDKSRLPVYWRANKKAWVTKDVFSDWFHNCFAPEVEKYITKKNLTFKVLLILDNAPGHPQDLEHPNIKVVFMPPNTTSLIQPLDQGIISTFKAYYLRRALQRIIDVMDSDNELTVIQTWKNFTIINAIEIISLACKELEKSTLNACWKSLWPEVVLKASEIEPVENQYKVIINLANSIGGDGFEDMVAEDIEELLTEKVDLTEEDLVEMADPSFSKSFVPETDSESDTNEPSGNLTLTSVKNGLELAEKLENYFLEHDPSMERSLKFKRELEKCLAPYKEIKKQLEMTKKQSLITEFIRTEKRQYDHGEQEKPSDSPPVKRSQPGIKAFFKHRDCGPKDTHDESDSESDWGEIC